jgi:isoquinoline 1-oxidoreductase beta subunit
VVEGDDPLPAILRAPRHRAYWSRAHAQGRRIEQANFDTYEMLRMNEAPAIEVHLIASTEAPGGMGEPTTAAIAPAVVNAIFGARGKRLRKLPVDGAKLRSTVHR